MYVCIYIYIYIIKASPPPAGAPDIKQGQNPKGPEAPPNPTYPQKVARGGAWQGLFGRATEAGLRSSRRYGLAAWTQAFNLGFRCAADAL